MKLYPMHRMLNMLDGHDLAVLGSRCHSQHRGHRSRRNDQRVIPSRQEWARQAGEEPGTLMMDAGCLSMHRSTGSHNLGTVGRADALVSKADAKNRDGWPELAHHIGGNP